MRIRSFVLLTCAVIGLTACSSDNYDELVLESPTAAEREEISGQEIGGVYGENLESGDYSAPEDATQAGLIKAIGDRVFFGYDRYDLDAQAQEVLQAQSAWLKAHTRLEITVEGHADERGTREYNLALGERRANSVRNYLVALGVDTNRITVISYGKERPAVAGTGDRVWAQNRRSVVVVD